MSQSAKAELFHKLHQGPQVLILPNAWDAASAAVMADTGAKAVATSSAAVAWAYGYADGDILPIDLVVATIAAAAKAAGDTPVTADIEGGFTDDLDALSHNIARVIEAGAVGINIEDGGRDPALHARKVAAVRAQAEKQGVRLFINARTDVYLRSLAEGEAAYDETVRRAALYAEAGADGIFVPGPADAELIGRLAAAIARPLNVMGRDGVPNAPELAALGARRLSSAIHPFRVAYAAMGRAVEAYLRDGDPGALARAGDGAPNLQQRFG
ncbi:MAG: isocitrate lyase/phosphoenolpyruvate mutase family protein [Alphaproteobacteria bacterium]|nr:isocitrate lyase/phosphoenolpyruvate mutase family protein [Alphaproteobacteria bacterium]MBU1517115.1 isocitrate lyase/phosphoenolpyruvate mutase family protein [Alphaproteobacteria bacterium]MBU2093734.1 isocitrate lyase/phosphoenolpyruvate mutase family protein [Alphaproteobacteria bacterium]MBU2153944.1 isocitrate lyase/phosphoenolpyruvate mutase family protein [Alphaproteobacteria bacterium]MBU2308666.1 isocitrate lyase/phosphoenolpyruvate mutase family protein [Alphaproteobacteria bact